MIQHTSSWLSDAIRDLVAIDDEGQLGELVEAFAADCRAAGGLPADRAAMLRVMQAGADAQAREVARAASHLFGVSIAECKRVAHEVLRRDPWRDIALQLIVEYRGRTTVTIHDAPGSDISAKLARERRRTA